MDSSKNERTYNERFGDRREGPDVNRTGISRSEDAGERDYDSLFSSSRRGTDYDDETSVGRSLGSREETAYRSGDRIEQEENNRDRDSDEGIYSRASDTSRYSRDDQNDRFAQTGLNGNYEEKRHYQGGSDKGIERVDKKNEDGRAYRQDDNRDRGARGASDQQQRNGYGRGYDNDDEEYSRKENRSK